MRVYISRILVFCLWPSRVAGSCDDMATEIVQKLFTHSDACTRKAMTSHYEDLDGHDTPLCRDTLLIAQCSVYTCALVPVFHSFCL